MSPDQALSVFLSSALQQNLFIADDNCIADGGLEVPLHPVAALLRASEVPAASEAGFEAAPDAAAWTRCDVGDGFYWYVHEAFHS